MFERQERSVPEGAKVYFASDFHLGIAGRFSSREREKLLLQWLENIEKDAAIIFLVGDIFDYWFEYEKVVPRGYVRLLGKLASMRDAGIEIVFFTGNHDMWMFRYFQEELGISLFKNPVKWILNGKSFLIGHGDGLGPGDYGYKFIKKIFNHPVSQWLFARIHPNTGIRLMQFFSGSSRPLYTPDTWNEKKEWLVQYCESRIAIEHTDYFVFGHRHLVIDYTLSNGTSRYLNLGDWVHYFTYGVFDGTSMQICFFLDGEESLISNKVK